MAIIFACACGRKLRTEDGRAGAKAQCPACSAIVEVPTPPPTPWREVDFHQHPDETRTDETLTAPPSVPPTLRTPVWLLYLGILTMASIAWGMMATLKLRERSRQVEVAQAQALSAEKASQESIARAETIKRQAFLEAEVIRREAKALREAAAVEKEQAQVTRLKEEEKLHKLYPDFRKLVPGENLVKQEYVEAFTIDNGTFRVRLRNASQTSVQPDFEVTFFDKNANRTEQASISWLWSSVEPGETRTDEKPFKPILGTPVYYVLKVQKPPPPVAVETDEARSMTFSVGTRVVLQASGYRRVFVAIDDSAWHEMLNAEVSGSTELMSRLVEQRRVIPVKGGTGAVIVQNGFLSKLVRITEGPQAGREGWIQNELVRQSK